MSDVMGQMQREMDSMMDLFGLGSDPFFSRSPFTMLDRLSSFPRTTAPSLGRLVPYELAEDDGKYTLKLEVPGFAKDDVKVSARCPTDTSAPFHPATTRHCSAAQMVPPRLLSIFMAPAEQSAATAQC